MSYFRTVGQASGLIEPLLALLVGLDPFDVDDGGA